MMIAYERGLETARKDAFFKDDLARMFQGKKGKELSDNFGNYATAFGFEGWPEFHKQWTAVRTKFIDEQVAAVAKAGKITQLVNLGAGLDTRSYRLKDYSKFDVFEVDMEIVNKAKSKIFDAITAKRHCKKIEFVSLDFMDEKMSLAKELAAKGFDPKKPAIFIAEGVIQYLGAKNLFFLGQVTDAAPPGSVFVLNYLESDQTITESKIKELLGEKSGKWTDLKILKYGDEGLNFGRYKKQFKPNKAFSFSVGTRVAKKE